VLRCDGVNSAGRLTGFFQEEDGDEEHEEDREDEPIVLADGETPGPAGADADGATFFVGCGSIHEKRLTTTVKQSGR
jgi:hypothetical protein